MENKNENIINWVKLQGVDLNNPLPVQLRDKDGKAIDLSKIGATQILGSGGGGKTDYFTIKGLMQSSFAEMMNPDGRVKVEMPAGGAGLTDIELRASHLDVQQLSGSIDSVYVAGAFGSVSASDMINADNRLRCSIETGGTGLTDAELRASSVPVAQVSGASWSVYVQGAGVSVGATILNGDGNSLDPRDRNWSITETVPISTIQSLEVKQVSGYTDSVAVNAALPTGTNIIGAIKDAGPNWTPSFTANEYTAAQTDTSAIAAPGIGISIYITDIIVCSSSAQTILLEEGTTTQLYKLYLAANGGAVMNFRTPRKLTADTALTITTTAGNVSLEIHYYTGA